MSAAIQDRPVCFECKGIIEHSPVFAAPCGHETCCSAVFHGLCLMEFRERQEHGDRFEVVGVLVRPWMQEHTENEGS